MNLSNIVRRAVARLSPERRELVRLAKMRRGTATTSTLIQPGFDTLDGESLAAQYQQIFRQNAFLFRPQTPAPRILDCGANVGVFTVYCRRQFPASRITAFEPDPRVFAVLERNVRRCCENPDGIDLVQAAVTGNAAESIVFYADHCDAGRTTTSLAGGTRIDVRAVRLRDYLTEPCDLLKMDIEGAEIDVLNDCADRLRNVTNVFVEYHSFSQQPQRLDELFAVLTRAGFRLFIQGGRPTPQPFLGTSPVLGMDGQLDIWGTRT